MSGRVGDHPSLPFSGTSAVSRQCSRAGATQAEPRAGSQAWRVLLAVKGQPLTYHELATALNLPLATCCARIGWLRTQGFVEAVGTKPGPFGTANTRWGLRGAA